MSDGVEFPDAVVESASFSPLWRLKTFNRLFFLSFFPSFSAGVSLAGGGADAGASVPLASSSDSLKGSTPNTFIVTAHSSHNFRSSSGVSVPGRPGGVFGAMTRYESVRSVTLKSAEDACSVLFFTGALVTSGTSRAPPIAIPETIATAQSPVPLFLQEAASASGAQWCPAYAQKAKLAD